MNISPYFTENVFDESLVLEFLVNAEQNTVILTCDYANDAVQAVLRRQKVQLSEGGITYHRDLRKLTFGSVTEYVREEATSKRFIKFKNKFFAKEHAATVIAQTVDIFKVKDSFRIEINFGDFGFCTFNFSQLNVERKLVRGKQIGAQECEYVDIHSGQKIDFYNPFLDVEHLVTKNEEQTLD